MVRLTKFLRLQINESQSTSFKSRQIFENFLGAHNILAYYRGIGQKTILCMLDFEKAFNLINLYLQCYRQEAFLINWLFKFAVLFP